MVIREATISRLMAGLASRLSDRDAGAFRAALELAREHSKASSVLVFRAQGDILRLVCSVPSLRAAPVTVRPPTGLFSSESASEWFPPEYDAPAGGARSFAVTSAPGVQCFIVFGFGTTEARSGVDFLQPVAMMLGVAALTHPGIAERGVTDEHSEYRAAFDRASVGMTLATVDGRIESVNARFAEMVGYTPDELCGRSFYELTAPEFRAENVRLLAEMQRCETVTIEKAYLHRDGSRVWCDVQVSLIRDPAGRPALVAGVIQNVVEKHATTEALRRSEERFRSLSECSPAGIFMADADGTCTYTNQRTQEIFGFTLDESLGNGWVEFTHPEDRDEAIAAWRRTVERQEPFSVVFRTLHRDGSSRWAHARAATVTADDGLPMGYVGSIEDITERKEFESALRESHTQTSRILESITDAFFATDRDWSVVYANKRAGEALGRTDMVESGLTLWELFPDALGTKFEEAYRNTIATQTPEHFEAFFPPHAKWYEVHAYPSADGLSIYFRDVTQRRRVEQELRYRDARFEIVTRATEEIIWDLDLDTGQAWRSSAAETVLRYDKSQIRADADWWYESIHPADRERVRSAFAAAIESAGNFWCEYRLKRGDGAWAFVLDRGAVLCDETGRPIRMTGGCMDITERHEAEQELKASREQARLLARRLINVQEEERTRIARDIHDILGQSLTAIKIDAVSIARQVPVAESAQAAAERIASVVDDTIEAVRDMSSRLRPIVLDDLGLLPALRAETRAFTERTGIQCQLETRLESVDLMDEASTAVFRIVQEALTNVARHAKATRVAVEVATRGNGVHVEIRDDGCGIVADRIESVGSLGVIGMRERAMLIDGDLSIGQGPQGGTSVCLHIPMTAPMLIRKTR